MRNVLCAAVLLLATTKIGYSEYKHHHKDDNEMSVDVMERKLKEHRTLFADIVLAQSVLESNWYKSDICRNGNNCFGMKLSGKRPTTTNESYKGYAKYKDIDDCINDYSLWQLWSGVQKMSKDEYINFISKNYAEDGEYRKKLEIMIQTLKK